MEKLHTRRRLCVVLVTRDSEEHDASRAFLREYSLGNEFGDKDKLRYTYIFREKQANFVNSLTSGWLFYCKILFNNMFIK